MIESSSNIAVAPAASASTRNGSQSQALAAGGSDSVLGSGGVGSGVGEARFVVPGVLNELFAAAELDSLLPVHVEAPGPGQRGRLGVLVEAAIERSLARRGACPPGVAAATDLALSLADQLYRARLIEMRGIALGLATLGGIADVEHTLDAEDSAVLRYLLTAAALHPLRIYLSSADRSLRVFTVPVALQELMPGASPTPLVCLETAQPPLVAPAVARSASAMEPSATPPEVISSELSATTPEVISSQLSAAPPEVISSELSAAPPEVISSELSAAPHVVAPRDDVSAAPPIAPPHGEERALESSAAAVPDVPEAVSSGAAAESAEMLAALTPPPSSVSGISLVPPDVAAFARATSESVGAPPLDRPRTPLKRAAHRELDPVIKRTATSQPEPTRPPEPAERQPPPQVDVAPQPATMASPQEPFERGPLYGSAAQDFRTWMEELSAARGPKPLSVIERMFVSAYVPLADAVARGIADVSARAVLATWATAFEQSYREAFAALRVRGKRPSMVLDIPDIALRIGRLHGARRVELIVVDGMRFDLGLRLEQRIRWRMAQEVALTERLLLWSALPATSSVQLELLGRGPEALKTWTGEVSSEIVVARGQNARTPRRVKVGHRDLLKLDLVEARLMDPGEHEAARLDELADELSEVLSAQLAKLPPRTLAIVFGDHGFKLDAMESGTTSARSGGASPEEVLVPAFAWLVGGVH